jgi:putative membrane protein
MQKLRFLRSSLLFSCLGLAVVVLLVLHAGISEVLGALEPLGFGIVWIVVYRFVPTALDTLGWMHLDAEQKAGFKLHLKARWYAEAINTLLPVAQIGGHLARAALIAPHSGKVRAAASTAVDFSLGLASQLVFILLGLAFAISLPRVDVDQAASLTIGLAAASLPVAGFFLAQKFRAASFFTGLVQKAVPKIAGSNLKELVQRVESEAFHMYKRPARVTSCFGLRLAGWISKGGEIWLILYLLQQPIGPLEAVALAAVAIFAQNAAFFVPGGLGVREGGIVLGAEIYGIPAETALAVGLIMRFRELAVGVPGLAMWWREQSRRFSFASSV